MVRGRFPRTAYPGVPVPFEQGTAVSSDADGEFNTIQAAIDATSAGGRVAVGPGTFSETVDCDTDNLTLVGSGRGTIVDGATTDHAILISTTGVTVERIAAQTSGGSGNDFDAIRADTGGAGVDESNITIRDAFVLDSDRDGIALQNTRDSRIIDCVVEQTDNIGIHVDQNGNRSSVEGCDAYGSVGGVGIFVHHGAGGVQLNACYVRNSGQAGIEFRSDAGVINGCVSRNSGNEGLILRNTQPAYITGSHFTNSTNEDLQIDEQASGGTLGDVTMEAVGFETKTIDAGVRVALNGQWFEATIPTIDLGGSDGEATPEVRNPIPTYDFFIDAGGSNTNLQGVNIQDESNNAIVERGDMLWLHHTGGETVTLEHNNGSASAPLLNDSLGNEDLDANDELVAYKFDGSAWREYANNIV